MKRMLLIVTFITLLYNNYIEVHAADATSPLSQPDKTIPKTIVLLKEKIHTAKQEYDTVGQINYLFDITQHYMTILEYTKAYESIWNALKLSQESKDSINMARIYQNLSELYAIYSKIDNSTDYINQAIQINKQYIARDSINATALTENYFKAAVNNISVYRYNEAMAYADSCLQLANQLNQDTIHKGYVYTIKAFIEIEQSNYPIAEEYLLRTKEVFEALPNDYPKYIIHKSYLVFIYAYLGNLYYHTGQIINSKTYYHLSLSTMDQWKAHIGFRPYVLYMLGRTYSKNQEYNMAYEAIRDSKLMYDSVYGVKSEQNIQLLEVRNNLQEELDIKNKELYQKAILLADKERSLFKIRLVLAGLFFLIIISILFIRNKNQRERYKLEKENLERENTLKEKAAQELIEVKNKELTTYTLQFIEKEKTIAEIIDLINSKKDLKQIKNHLKTIQINDNQWEEFNHRFNSVNSGFYDRLSAKFPNLSTTEQKHCALIKLNFSGKEMAHLLGISTSSVHISRHRLRKKMGLDRDVNLSTFIAKI